MTVGPYTHSVDFGRISSMVYIARAFGPEIQVAEIGIDINFDGDRVVTKAYSRSD